MEREKEKNRRNDWQIDRETAICKPTQQKDSSAIRESVARAKNHLPDTQSRTLVFHSDLRLIELYNFFFLSPLPLLLLRDELEEHKLNNCSYEIFFLFLLGWMLLDDGAVPPYPRYLWISEMTFEKIGFDEVAKSCRRVCCFSSRGAQELYGLDLIDGRTQTHTHA